ncbi:hypothetical protein [Urbifossiella limnaea]|uniref:Serine protease n=1 Tax=Urbifossiella limnaea TaxID=2528023 RepID=A0A517Y009_9BACT|nr:hypothetical protein [Urbifossiella limnaea]QDU23073.1 hypothetical protein ETAA1_50640 [Urbifossiella limnaea]
MSRRPVWAFAAFATGFGLLVVFGGNPTATGQPKPLVVPPAPQAPSLTSAANLGAKPGDTAELTLPGGNLADATGVSISCPGAKAEVVPDAKADAGKVKVKVTLPADAAVGLYGLRAATKHGVSNLRPFVVDDLPAVAETDANRSKDTAQPVTAPCVVLGRTDAEVSDFFKLKVSAGQRLTFEVLARRIGSPLDPIVVLHDGATKRELIDKYADDTPGLQADARLTHTFPAAGEVLVEVRDTTYRGGADFFYRLRIGDFPGATTAFPLAVERGKDAKVGFAGPGTEDLPPVTLKVPMTAAGVNAAPKRAGGPSGWPVPVMVSRNPEGVEAEPNNEPAKANPLPVPGGVSAKFGSKGDTDHFKIAGKKGQKLVIAALTYEVNAPTEVLVRVLDAKGAELAKSNPAAVPTRFEFTPPADGDYVVACEHLNYLFGPNEVYHLSVVPAGPDVAVTLALDRYEAPAGGGTAVAVTNVARLNGYAGPVELSIDGGPDLSGKVTLPAGATQAFVPLLVKAGAKPGPLAFRVKATAGDVVRYGQLTDLVKTTFGGMSNPPHEFLDGCAVAVVEKAPFAVALKLDPASLEKGKGGKLLVEAKREKEADGDIALAPLFAPAKVTIAPKGSLAKGATKGDLAVTTAADVPLGPAPLVIRATTKVGGKDYAVTPPPVVADIVEPKKAEPKKAEPKKDKDKK